MSIFYCALRIFLCELSEYDCAVFLKSPNIYIMSRLFT